jgi:hypothetical protein
MREAGRRFWRWFRARPWHWQLTIGAAFVAVAVLVTAFTVKVAIEEDTGLDFVGPRSLPPADVRHELAARFAPILRLDSKELFVPIDAASYVSTTTLSERMGKRIVPVDDAPGLDSLPSDEGGCRLGRRCTFVLDVRGAEPPKSHPRDYKVIDDRLLKAGARLTVYSRVLRYDLSGDMAVQYWFLYLFNYRLNEHESDWEQITIGVDRDGTPRKVLYSSHATGFVRDWEDVEREGDHPIVYPAVGSHANYFHAGSHAVTLSCKNIHRKRFCVRKLDVRDRSDGRGLELDPQNYALAELVPPIFIGSFGTGNYVAGHRLNEVLSDPRTRPAWTNPLARLLKGRPLSAHLLETAPAG